MCFNLLQRYFSEGFPSDKERALNTLRYIHANPKAAGMQSGFFYDFSNYGSYERLTDDGLTEWHPMFLELGQSLDECAEKYRRFCNNYKPKSKTAHARKSSWGSRFLPHWPERAANPHPHYSGVYLGTLQSRKNQPFWKKWCNYLGGRMRIIHFNPYFVG
jgi:putative transposase